jgi:hypothetical protein|tara:strand:+ start:374 stop:751 length:378 start_codon:yes stop_codon:yes gene_type:complete
MPHNFQEDANIQNLHSSNPHGGAKRKDEYQSNKANKGVVSIGSNKTLRESGHPEYKKARIDKLRELYEKCEPKFEYYSKLPAGETDGRKSVRTERIIGEDISPFDLPNFEELMPKKEDYLDRYIG